jgi:integrase
MKTKTVAITQLFLAQIRPPKEGRAEYRDKHQPNLRLRVSKGAMTWSAVGRVGGKVERKTIGTVAEIPEAAEARRRAAAIREAAREAQAEQPAAITVAEAVVKYLATVDRDAALKTRQEWHRIFAHDVLPAWGARPLAEISKADILLLLHDKAAKREIPRKGMTHGAGVQSNRVLARLHTFFAWAVANDLLTADPSKGVRAVVKEKSRDRVLTDDEIVRLWAGCDRLTRAPYYGALIKLLLLTAARRSEVAAMGWSEINLVERTWTVPAARSKNGKPHILHLGDLAFEVLATVPRVEGRDYLFSIGQNPVSDFVRPKAKLDKAVGTDDWQIHDLRRTATTGLARIGVAPHIADKLLNHQGGTIKGVAAVYNRFQYLDERAGALQAWGRFVEGLVRPVPSNVVPMALRQD